MEDVNLGRQQVTVLIDPSRWYFLWISQFRDNRNPVDPSLVSLRGAGPHHVTPCLCHLLAMQCDNLRDKVKAVCGWCWSWSFLVPLPSLGPFRWAKLLESCSKATRRKKVLQDPCGLDCHPGPATKKPEPPFCLCNPSLSILFSSRGRGRKLVCGTVCGYLPIFLSSIELSNCCPATSSKTARLIPEYRVDWSSNPLRYLQRRVKSSHLTV